MSSSTSIHPFQLDWQSDFPDHTYDPLYLANTHFGGLLDLSGSTMDLWSSSLVARPEGDSSDGFFFPITMIRLQAFYRTPTMRKEGVWLGSTGIHTEDPRYTTDPSMPHLPQIWDCRQSLDLCTGIASNKGRITLGGSSAPPDRSVCFESRILFLKDSAVMGIEILVPEEVEILILPEPILEERFGLDLSGKGIHRLGNEVRADITLRQSLTESRTDATSVEHVLQPNGGESYTVTVQASDAEGVFLNGLPGLMGHGRLFATITLREGRLAAPPAVTTGRFEGFEDMASEQSRRWSTFWQTSSIRLPDGEALWQQRYHASLFYVEQSIGNGPTHPGGLAKPMLPYWFGCFHDTDTYLCRPLLESGRPAGPLRHLAFRHRTLEVARTAARTLNRPGALYPWQTDPGGRGPVHEVPMNAAIIACEAWHQAGFAGGRLAREQAREIVEETYTYLLDLLDPESSPLSFKPGALCTFSETMVADDSCEARIAVRAVTAAFLEAVGTHPLARRILDELLPLRKNNGDYAITTGAEPVYLRCPSVTLGSFPLHHLPADAALASALEEEHKRIIHRFAWLPHQASIVASQLCRPEAVVLLRQADAFYKCWHAYDEWENRRLARAAVFVTAAGGFCTALHHLLLAETGPGVWSLFPGIPEEWQDVAFQNLLTRHGWRISARREAGRVVHLEVVPCHNKDKNVPPLCLFVDGTPRHFSADKDRP